MQFSKLARLAEKLHAVLQQYFQRSGSSFPRLKGQWSMTYKDESSSDMDAISNNLLMMNKSKEGSGMNLGQIDENSDSNTRLIDLAADRTKPDSAGNNQDKPKPK